MSLFIHSKNPGDSIGFGKDSRVADCVAERVQKSNKRTAVDIRLQNNQKNVSVAQQNSDEQNYGKFSTRGFDDRRTSVK